MRNGRAIATPLILVLFLAILPGGFFATGEPLKRMECRVTYVTSTSVYIDAGTGAGLQVGDLVELMSGDQAIMVLKVRDVSGRRSACVPQDQDLALTGLVKIGDSVRFEKSHASQPAAGAVSEPEPAISESDPVPEPPEIHADSPGILDSLRGRLGLAYLVVNDRASDSGGFTRLEPTLRLDGDHLGGSAFSLHVDTRMRRSFFNSSDEPHYSTGIYRLSVEWQQADSPYRLSLGRQYSPGLSGLSLFDGLLAERRTDRWAFGLFAGTQPDPLDLTFSLDTPEFGVFAQRASAPDSEKQWQITGGLIGSYGKGKDFREFLFLQANYFTRRLTLSFNQEVDFNRDWKVEAGESSVSPTSTFAIIRYRVNDALTLDAGYDDRRNVILYREFENPETEFDDSYRRGLWGGAEVQFLSRFRAGLHYRGNSGGSAGSSDSYTINFWARDLFPIHLGLSTRSTRFENDHTEGWLHTLAFYFPVGQRMQLSLYGGLRQDTEIDTIFPELADQSLIWYGVDMDVRLGRSWFFLASVERNTGDEQEYNQIYTMLNYRF